MKLAPIVLFVYNRPWHTQQTVEALQRNIFASESKLFIFSDGPKNEQQIGRVNEVRRYLETVGGFAKVTIIKCDKNLGLANSVIAGVTEIVNNYGRVIVLEDDLVTSPYFLQFMNEALTLYENDDEVGSIQGYMYENPFNIQRLPESFFFRTADCWGWATWKRAWCLFNPDAAVLLKRLQNGGDLRRFNFDGTYNLSGMLEEQIRGSINSWGIRWVTSLFIENKLSLYSGQSLVNNIGLDSSGTHCGTSSLHAVDLCMRPILVKRSLLIENKLAYRIHKRFFRQLKGEYFFSPVIFKVKAFAKVVFPEKVWRILKIIKMFILYRRIKRL